MPGALERNQSVNIASKHVAAPASDIEGQHSMLAAMEEASGLPGPVARNATRPRACVAVDVPLDASGVPLPQVTEGGDPPAAGGSLAQAGGGFRADRALGLLQLTTQWDGTEFPAASAPPVHALRHGRRCARAATIAAARSRTWCREWRPGRPPC